MKGMTQRIHLNNYSRFVFSGLRFAMLEMKFAFCKILPKYQFTMSDKMKYPVTFKAGGPLLAPEDGIWLNIEKV